MYLLVVLLLFGIFGIAAVTIDLGLVTLSRVQMQNAADSAALEGLRQRDALGDAGRRDAARDLVANMFDDDLNPVNGDVRNLGAGPNLSAQGGLNGINASAQLAIGDPLVYKPALQTNAANEVHGDMVAGEHCADPVLCPPVETADYTRLDFNPTGPPNAFLVRLRRTNNRDGLDSVDGVSSSGAALPLLFGHASLVNGEPGSAYNPRVDGFTVRGTAIAALRPVVQVRPASVTSYALSRAFWDSLTPGALIAAELDALGFVRVGASPGTVVGRFITPVRTIGEALSSTTNCTNPLSGYVPLFENINGLDRVIGFGRITVVGACGGPVSLLREAAQIATANASAMIESPPVMPPADWAMVRASNLTLTSGLQWPVLVQ